MLLYITPTHLTHSLVHKCGGFYRSGKRNSRMKIKIREDFLRFLNPDFEEKYAHLSRKEFKWKKQKAQ